MSYKHYVSGLRPRKILASILRSCRTAPRRRSGTLGPSRRSSRPSGSSSSSWARRKTLSSGFHFLLSVVLHLFREKLEELEEDIGDQQVRKTADEKL